MKAGRWRCHHAGEDHIDVQRACRQDPGRCRGHGYACPLGPQDVYLPSDSVFFRPERCHGSRWVSWASECSVLAASAYCWWALIVTKADWYSSSSSYCQPPLEFRVFLVSSFQLFLIGNLSLFYPRKKTINDVKVKGSVDRLSCHRRCKIARQRDGNQSSFCVRRFCSFSTLCLIFFLFLFFVLLCTSGRPVTESIRTPSWLHERNGFPGEVDLLEQRAEAAARPDFAAVACASRSRVGLEAPNQLRSQTPKNPFRWRTVFFSFL